MALVQTVRGVIKLSLKKASNDVRAFFLAPAVVDGVPEQQLLAASVRPSAQILPSPLCRTTHTFVVLDPSFSIPPFLFSNLQSAFESIALASVFALSWKRSA